MKCESIRFVSFPGLGLAAPDEIPTGAVGVLAVARGPVIATAGAAGGLGVESGCSKSLLLIKRKLICLYFPGPDTEGDHGLGRETRNGRGWSIIEGMTAFSFNLSFLFLFSDSS